MVADSVDEAALALLSSLAMPALAAVRLMCVSAEPILPIGLSSQAAVAAVAPLVVIKTQKDLLRVPAVEEVPAAESAAVKVLIRQQLVEWQAAVPEAQTVVAARLEPAAQDFLALSERCPTVVLDKLAVVARLILSPMAAAAVVT